MLLGEPVGASADRSIAMHHEQVFVQVTLLVESLATEAAFEGLFASVDSQVYVHIAFRLYYFIASRVHALVLEFF